MLTKSARGVVGVGEENQDFKIILTMPSPLCHCKAAQQELLEYVSMYLMELLQTID